MKRLAPLTAATIVALFLFTAVPAGAVSLGIGISTWFNWWSPYWKDVKNSPNDRVESTVKPNFLYGPMISLKLPAHFRINSLFLMGDYEMERKGYMVLMPATMLLPFRGGAAIRRYDSDSAVGYSFNRYITMNVGFKYSRYAYKEQEIVFSIFSLRDKTYNEYAPALGLGAIAPLYKNSLFLLVNASILYAFCDVTKKGYMIIFNVNYPSSGLQDRKKLYRFQKAGLNTTLSLAYLVEKINTTFTAGFRYQTTMLVSSDGSFDSRTVKKMDHFYGVTAGAMYTFDFEGRKDKKAVSDDL